MKNQLTSGNVIVFYGCINLMSQTRSLRSQLSLVMVICLDYTLKHSEVPGALYTKSFLWYKKFCTTWEVYVPSKIFIFFWTNIDSLFPLNTLIPEDLLLFPTLGSDLILLWCWIAVFSDYRSFSKGLVPHANSSTCKSESRGEAIRKPSPVCSCSEHIIFQPNWNMVHKY
jgi:hypothetical protein